MGRAVVRRHATLTATLGLLLLGTSGCAQDPAGLPTEVDFERAQRVWSDPWLAPDQALVPGAAWGSPDGWVTREAGIRTTDYRDSQPLVALTREVTSALAEGWRLTGARCDGQPAASLVRGEGLETGTVAVARTDDLGPVTRVTVTGSVPHHLDGSWPAPADELTLADSCLSGGDAAGASVDDLDRGPPEDPPDDPARPDSDEWDRESPSADEEALLDAVNADPWIATLGLSISADLSADDALRRAPDATLTLDGQPLTEVVAAMSDWELTWMSCGRGRATEATARLVTDAGIAVARLTGLSRRTEVTVTLPLPEAPAPDWVAEVPSLADPSCLPGAPRGPRIVLEGIPVATVSVSQPVAD